MAFADPQHNINQLGIPEGARVADLGSGSGFYSIEAAKKVGPDGRVYAVDVQAEMLSLLEKKARDESISNIAVLRGDLEHLGGSTLQDSFVDVVLVSNIFFQIDDKSMFLKEAYRILRPGGRMLFIDWSESFGGMGPEQERVVGESEARTMLEETGFVFDTSIQAGDHHYGMIFRKPK